MTTIPLTKMSGAGNTFLIIDLRATDSAHDLTPPQRIDMTKLLCARGEQGADGLLFLEKTTAADFKWDFYNSDGSNAEMCGNAARCVVEFVYRTGLRKAIYTFETRAGVIRAERLKPGLVKVALVKVTKERRGPYTVWNSGVPHIVVKKAGVLEPEKLRSEAQKIRTAAELQPQGANVSFYALKSKEVVEAITFERGVENFTLACGTGAIAVAAALQEETQSAGPFYIHMPGGKLVAEFVGTQPYLTGPAEFVADFSWSPT